MPRTKISTSLEEGLRVRHIAASPLVGCSAADDPEEVLDRPKFRGFDQIPIQDGNRVTGVLERSNPAQTRPLDDSVLVSADAPLFDFIHTVHQQSYRLVVDKTAISGIVTWSDLLKLPVIILAFSVIAELELAMTGRIKEEYGDSDEWLKLLDPEQVKKIKGWEKRLRADNLTLATIEVAGLEHKAKVLERYFSNGRDFQTDFKNVVSLRHNIAPQRKPRWQRSPIPNGCRTGGIQRRMLWHTRIGAESSWVVCSRV